MVVAQGLAFAVLLGGGILIGMAIDDDPVVPPKTQARPERAERAAAASAEQLRQARNELGTGEAQARTRIDTLVRQNRRLRRQLTRTRAALRRARD